MELQLAVLLRQLKLFRALARLLLQRVGGGAETKGAPERCLSSILEVLVQSITSEDLPPLTAQQSSLVFWRVIA